MDDDNFIYLFEPGSNEKNTPISEAHWWFLYSDISKWQHLEDCRSNGLTQNNIDLIYKVYREKKATIKKENNKS